jgi:hypothetical protein
MPDFHWQDTATQPLGERFPDQTIGRDAWRQLVDRLHGIRGAGPGQLDIQLPQAFEQFMQQAQTAAQLVRPGLPECRVFVSHRQVQADVDIAERIAYRATLRGYGYWLDVHNPTLKYLDGSSIPRPIKDVLIAAIIEIGLLNASHIIAAMTPHSAGSKWIPYEFGRAKHKSVHSIFSASWISPGMSTMDCGEYIYLASITKTEDDIDSWLTHTSSGRCFPPRNTSWRGSGTAPLPTTP